MPNFVRRALDSLRPRAQAETSINMVLYRNWRRTPYQAVEDHIAQWEGGFQDHPEDTANWVDGELIGTKWGITPRTLAHVRNVPLSSISRSDIEELEMQEACEISFRMFFEGPGWDEVPWCPATESLFDFGYMIGPFDAVRKMQRLVEVGDDGIIGPFTVRAYTEWLRDCGHRAAAHAICDMRINHHQRVVQKRPSQEVFLKGWTNRARWYSPANEDWWTRWMHQS